MCLVCPMNLLRLMIKPGMNDLGTIVIPTALFGRECKPNGSVAPLADDLNATGV